MGGDKVFVVFHKRNSLSQQTMFQQSSDVVEFVANFDADEQVSSIWCLDEFGNTYQCSIVFEKGRLKLEHLPKSA